LEKDVIEGGQKKPVQSTGPLKQGGSAMDEKKHLERKPPGRVLPDSEERILVGRKEAARLLSISQRSLDYLVANKELAVRRIGSRVLITVAELRRFARIDNQERIAS
jgi:excisionase family DNA binding protein